jgi:hypothetical protein
VKEQAPLADAYAQRRGSIIVRGAAAHATASLPLAAEPLDDLAAVRIERREANQAVQRLHLISFAPSRPNPIAPFPLGSAYA